MRLPSREQTSFVLASASFANSLEPGTSSLKEAWATKMERTWCAASEMAVGLGAQMAKAGEKGAGTARARWAKERRCVSGSARWAAA